jgi:hypothetical protein
MLLYLWLCDSCGLSNVAGAAHLARLGVIRGSRHDYGNAVSLSQLLLTKLKLLIFVSSGEDETYGHLHVGPVSLKYIHRN